MSTDAQYASFVDRVIACREAEDRAKADTKALYAEIAEAGEDKTAIGILVRELRLTAKEKVKADFRDAAVEDGRARYRRGKASHVRAREAAAAGADPETGEINSSTAARKDVQAETTVESTRAVAPDPAAGTTLPAGTQAPPVDTIPEPVASDPTDPLRSGAAEGDEAETAAQEPIPQPIEGTTPTSTADGDRGGQVPPSQPAPVVPSNDYSKPNPWCQDPEDCGVNASWNHMCGGCMRLRAERQAVGAVQ